MPKYLTIGQDCLDMDGQKLVQLSNGWTLLIFQWLDTIVSNCPLVVTCWTSLSIAQVSVQLADDASSVIAIKVVPQKVILEND